VEFSALLSASRSKTYNLHVYVVGCVVNSGEHQLGFERGTISGKSWYEIIHPDDVDEARFKHMDRK